MKKTMTRLMAVLILMTGWTVAFAQGSVTVDQANRMLQQRRQQQQQQSGQRQVNQPQTNYYSSASQPFATFFLEYNPTTLHVSYKGHSNNTSYQGLSLGGNYFYPFAGSLGADFGLKLQYFFRSEKENGVKTNSNLLSATIPVNLAYDWHVSDGLAIYPYAGLFARFNIIAKSKVESDGHSRTYDAFSKDDMGEHTWDRFQFGWQAGVNCRISETFIVGGGFWMDLNEITDHTKIYGFNATLGIKF